MPRRIYILLALAVCAGLATAAGEWIADLPADGGVRVANATPTDDPPDLETEYLVICHQDYVNNDGLWGPSGLISNWLTRRGYRWGRVVVTSNTEPSVIRTTIKNVYYAPPTPVLKWVLLVGNHKEVKPYGYDQPWNFAGSEFEAFKFCDFAFADFDWDRAQPDHVPEVRLGRLSPQPNNGTVQQRNQDLTEQATKILNYMNFTAGGTWPDSLLMVADGSEGGQSNMFWDYCGAWMGRPGVVHQMLESPRFDYFQPEWKMLVGSNCDLDRLMHDWNSSVMREDSARERITARAQNTNVAAALNSGAGIVVYAGHGGNAEPRWKEWADRYPENWDRGDIAELVNEHKTPVVFNICCSTGFYLDGQMNLSEAWMSKHAGGAVASFSSSANCRGGDFGYVTTEAMLHALCYTDRGQRAAICDLGGMMQYWCQTLATTPNPLPGEHPRKNIYSFTLLGDPSMNVWTGAPHAAVVYCTPEIRRGVSCAVKCTVRTQVGTQQHPIYKARVCLWKGDELYAIGHTTYNGSVVFSSVTVETEGEIHVTVTEGHTVYPHTVNGVYKHVAIIPYTGTIQVVAPYDAEALSIEYPTGTVQHAEVIVPQATLRNNSNELISEVGVRFEIWREELQYTDEYSLVDPIGPGEERTVEFAPLASRELSGGDHLARFIVDLDGDMIPENDVCEETFSVQATGYWFGLPHGSLDSPHLVAGAAGTDAIYALSRHDIVPNRFARYHLPDGPWDFHAAPEDLEIVFSADRFGDHIYAIGLDHNGQGRVERYCLQGVDNWEFVVEVDDEYVNVEEGCCIFAAGDNEFYVLSGGEDSRFAQYHGDWEPKEDVPSDFLTSFTTSGTSSGDPSDHTIYLLTQGTSQGDPRRHLLQYRDDHWEHIHTDDVTGLLVGRSSVVYDETMGLLYAFWPDEFWEAGFWSYDLPARLRWRELPGFLKPLGEFPSLAIADGLPHGYAGSVLSTEPVFAVYFPLPIEDDNCFGIASRTALVGGRFSCTPNPFRGRTDIRWMMPSESRVALRVFDISGRAVRTLKTGTLTAGSYCERWNGQSDDGDQVPAGIYLCVLDAGEYRATQRITLTR